MECAAYPTYCPTGPLHRTARQRQPRPRRLRRGQEGRRHGQRRHCRRRAHHPQRGRRQGGLHRACTLTLRALHTLTSGPRTSLLTLTLTLTLTSAARTSLLTLTLTLASGPLASSRSRRPRPRTRTSCPSRLSRRRPSGHALRNEHEMIPPPLLCPPTHFSSSCASLPYARAIV